MKGSGKMEAIENLLTRKSIRKYADKAISEEDLRTILTAGMTGPSCVNARDWSFLVVTDKDKLNAMADANGRPAEPLRTAAAGVLVCGDTEKAFRDAKDYWVIDGAIAAENMILAAHALGIGSVWLGTWPQMERVEAQAKLSDLPGHIIPHSIIAFGYPVGEEKRRDPVYEEECVHFNQW